MVLKEGRDGGSIEYVLGKARLEWQQLVQLELENALVSKPVSFLLTVFIITALDSLDVIFQYSTMV